MGLTMKHKASKLKWFPYEIKAKVDDYEVFLYKTYEDWNWHVKHRYGIHWLRSGTGKSLSIVRKIALEVVQNEKDREILRRQISNSWLKKNKKSP